jgi:hypothetical protein
MDVNWSIWFIGINWSISCIIHKQNAAQSCPHLIPQCDQEICLWASHRGSKRATLDVSAREKPVLSTSTIVALAGQTEDTEMPISAVAGSAGRERSCGLDERVVACRVPESDLVGGEVDFVGNVVPLVCLELGLPLALATHHPLQVGVGCAGLAIDPAVLQLCEVALEEADLVRLWFPS